MGDGVLIYFGYPEAHEDDAERAGGPIAWLLRCAGWAIDDDKRQQEDNTEPQGGLGNEKRC
jgi:hypothetical protein